MNFWTYLYQTGELELVYRFASAVRSSRVLEVQVESIESVSPEERDDAVDERRSRLRVRQHDARLKAKTMAAWCSLVHALSKDYGSLVQWFDVVDSAR